MITTKTQLKYLELMNASEMHQAAIKWLSELHFIKDEQLFFDDLVKTYTPQLLDLTEFANNKEIIDILNKSQKHTDELIQRIIEHNNGLEVLVDTLKQPKEETAYKKEHEALTIVLSEFFISYQNLKMQLFQIFKNILKNEKQIRLLNRE